MKEWNEGMKEWMKGMKGMKEWRNEWKEWKEWIFIPSTLPSNPFNNYYIYSMYIIILNLHLYIIDI